MNATPSRTDCPRASRPSPASQSAGGFSFVELLVAAAILAVAITVGVVAFGAIANSEFVRAGDARVTLPSPVTLTTFYNMNTNAVAAPMAPAYAELLRAESMRDLLYSDLGFATAVFCLARVNPVAVRPGSVTLPVGTDVRTINRPGAFAAMLGAPGSVFANYTNVPPLAASSTSLFVMQSTTNATSARVRAVYEMDVVPTAAPEGHYASVRRYSGSVLTAFYHVFYPGTNANNFSPSVVFFDRAHQLPSAGEAVDRFRLARNMPFYLVWWPDPSVPRLTEVNTLMPTPPASVPRAAYPGMANRTSFFFVIPAFPAL